jgi:hypothetical protein
MGFASESPRRAGLALHRGNEMKGTILSPDLCGASILQADRGSPKGRFDGDRQRTPDSGIMSLSG